MPTKEWARANPEKMREARRKWYKNNKEKAYKKVDSRRREIKKWFLEYKSELSCETCGFSHPAALDFHHTDSKEKETEISKMVTESYSKENILNEIAKCRILCSNCHRILHFDERTKK